METALSEQITPRLRLPWLIAGQAQKHVTLNESLALLGALIACRALSRTVGAQPADPAEGDLYLLPGTPTGAAWGAWSEGDLALFDFGAWRRLTAPDGLILLIVDEARLVVRQDGGWSELGGMLGRVQNLERLGVGTEADGANPFAARLNTALWTALPAGDGGDGDLRFTFNKEATADVGSLLFQSNWSGRAEIGLIGDDDLTVKVSPDGAAWTTALSLSRATGAARFAAGSASAPAVALGEAGTGLFRPSANVLGLAFGGTARAQWQANRWTWNGLTHEAVGGLTNGFQIQGTQVGNASFFNLLWNASNATGPVNILGKSRGGELNAHGLVQSGDDLGSVRWYGSDGSDWLMGARIRAVVDAAPGTGDLPTRLEFAVTPDGASAPVERLRISNAGELMMGGANTVIDASRHHRLRAYTVATLPSASPAAQMIYVSDGSSNRRLAVSDGSAWRFPDGSAVS